MNFILISSLSDRPDGSVISLTMMNCGPSRVQSVWWNLQRQSRSLHQNYEDRPALWGANWEPMTAHPEIIPLRRVETAVLDEAGQKSQYERTPLLWGIVERADSQQWN